MKRIPHWIGGKPDTGASGRVGPVFDPAAGRQTASVGLASLDDVADVATVAAAAAPAWAARSLSARADMLFRLRDLVDRHRSEHGKVLGDAAGEVARGLENIEFACGIPHLLKGTHSTEAFSGVDVHTVLHRRQPDHHDLLRDLSVGVAERRHQAGHRGDPALHRQRPSGGQHHSQRHARPAPEPPDGFGGERCRVDPLHPRGP